MLTSGKAWHTFVFREGMKMSIGGFSFKRLMGVTSAKRTISKLTGIPTTKQGRKNKLNQLVVNAIKGKVK